MPYIKSKTVETVKFSGGKVQHQDASQTKGSLNVSAGFKTPRSALKSQKDHGGQVCNYKKIAADLIIRSKLYEDPDFLAEDSSVFFSQKPTTPFKWLRPHEISKNPKFLDEKASRFDVVQGKLGDCWLLAAVSCLALHSELFEQVVPPGQDFGPRYCGMFHFRFWQFGEWKEVVVDDRLPTVNGEMAFMQSNKENVFWSALLEKAYAKLQGSYETLKGGLSGEALEDFTGGIIETVDLKKPPPSNLLNVMMKAGKQCSIMGCSIDAKPNEIELIMPNGLIKGHAYSITDVKLVDIDVPGKKGKIPLIRIRNPWGNEREWKGAFGDNSREWLLIDDDDKKKLGLTFEDDGEFWMMYSDFVKHFDRLEICRLGPQSSDDKLSGKPKRRWEMCLEQGSWKGKVSAGGCRNFLSTFWTNPQFRINVVDPDEDDDENMGTLIVGLMQKDMRKRRSEGLQFYCIGYAIYELKDNEEGVLPETFFKYKQSVARSTYPNVREVCTRHKLPPGKYVIVPSTFNPNEQADFLLRIFAEKPYESTEMDVQTTIKDVEQTRQLTSSEEQQLAALKEAFRNVAGVDEEIDAYEMQDVLNTVFKKEFNFDGFSVETCRSMVSMMDYDQSGKLGFEEFFILWNDLRLWKTAFKKYDVDKSGSFNSYELRKALSAIGFNVSNKIFNSLVMRFASKEGVIHFDDYILCCVRFKTIFETFKAQTKTQGGDAVFDQDTFIQCIMYV